MLQISYRRHLLRLSHSSKVQYSTTVKPEQHTFTESPRSNHHDLPSFLDYASRFDIDPKSSVYVGTHYEYTVQSALERLGLSLKRIGGRSDHGIDLLGTWDLPSIPSPLKVLVQCRARSAKSMPSEVREVEGSFVGAPSGWRGAGVLGLLVSKKEATKGVRDAVGRSHWPMGFMMCTDQGKILQALWNRKAEEVGLLGVGVRLKYVGGKREDNEVLLTWQGKTLGDDV